MLMIYLALGISLLAFNLSSSFAEDCFQMGNFERGFCHLILSCLNLGFFLYNLSRLVEN